MKLAICKNPICVTTHGIKHLVPCGKCQYCKQMRSEIMANRLYFECLNHRYCIFGTLTYANCFLPSMQYSDSARSFYFSENTLNCLDAGTCFGFMFYSKHDKSCYANAIKNHGFVPRLSKYDVQCFLKRLRINIQRLFPNLPYEKLRIQYALCGEYGPTTFRPHYHFTIAFDNEEIAKNFSKILSKSWSYGSASWRYSTDARSKFYTARYVNCVYNLPNYLKRKEICPFLLVSKKYPLGSSAIKQEEIRRIFDLRSPTTTLFDPSKGAYTVVPLWSFLENRIFPKFSGFNYFPSHLRIKLLRQAFGSEDYQSFAYKMHCYLNKFNNINRPELYELLSLMFKKRFEDCFDLKHLDSFLYSVYRCALRIRKNMLEFDVTSPEEYLKIIEEYDDNKYKFKLEQQFKFENDYISLHPNELKFIDIDNFSSEILSTCSAKNYFDLVDCIVNHSKKNRAKNDYLNQHPEYRLYAFEGEFLEGLV